MVVLVVGGAGYIGSHAARALKRLGHTPVIYDNLSSGHTHAIPIASWDGNWKAGLPQ